MRILSIFVFVHFFRGFLLLTFVRSISEILKLMDILYTVQYNRLSDSPRKRRFDDR
jgi:hypothetical protein